VTESVHSGPGRSDPERGVAVVIAAKDEEARIAATVTAARSIPGVELVVVVDDGSGDRTAVVARSAGAHVVRHQRNQGKAAAMQTGAAAVDAATRRGDRRAVAEGLLLLFLDADLEASAVQAAPLIGPVRDGTADMTIAVLPEQATAGGGHGLVVGLARSGIRQATGWTATQPLSGQRCLTPEAFAAARPLAGGFGVETGLTIDLLRQDYRVLEVPCDLHHRVTGRDLRSQLHRGRQYRDVVLALARRGVLPQRLDRVSADVARRSAAWRDRVRRG
jgi:glycosyltransferase involved in cell wall biosynthesis